MSLILTSIRMLTSSSRETVCLALGDLANNLVKVELHRLPDTIRSFSRRCFCEQLHHPLSLGLPSPCHLDSSEGCIFVTTSHRLSFDTSLIYILLSIFRAMVYSLGPGPRHLSLRVWPQFPRWSLRLQSLLPGSRGLVESK